jgi:hypothetical protein
MLRYFHLKIEELSTRTNGNIVKPEQVETLTMLFSRATSRTKREMSEGSGQSRSPFKFFSKTDQTDGDAAMGFA